MSVTDELVKIQEENNSMICLGLDLDTKRMPSDYIQNSRSMFEFAYQIIENTKDVVCAYKPNMAFFESMGPEGLSLLRLIIERVPENIPVILDGKRGDIGNTAGHYATALFGRYKATWITVNPYMGYDSLRPFLEYKDNGVFILCLTSNNGSKDFQMLEVDGKPLYKIVAEKVAYWNKEGNCGLVVGATQPEQLKDVRSVADQMPILIPGVGAQGGSLELATRNGTANFTRPAVINVSRSVLYASSGEDFARRAREEIIKLNNSINSFKASEPTQPQNGQPPLEQKTEPERIIVQSQVSIQATPIEEPKESVQTEQPTPTNNIQENIQAPPVEEPKEPIQPETPTPTNNIQENIQAPPVEEPKEPVQSEPPTPTNTSHENIQAPPVEEPKESVQPQQQNNNFSHQKPDYSKPFEPSKPVETEENKPVEPDKQNESSDRTERWDRREDLHRERESEKAPSENMNSEPQKIEPKPPKPIEKPFVPRPIPKPPSTLPFGNKPGINPNSKRNDEDKKED